MLEVVHVWTVGYFQLQCNFAFRWDISTEYKHQNIIRIFENIAFVKYSNLRNIVEISLGGLLCCVNNIPICVRGFNLAFMLSRNLFPFLCQLHHSSSIHQTVPKRMAHYPNIGQNDQLVLPTFKGCLQSDRLRNNSVFTISAHSIRCPIVGNEMLWPCRSHNDVLHITPRQVGICLQGQRTNPCCQRGGRRGSCVT